MTRADPPRPFRLLIDGQGIQGEGRRRGVGRYARELLGGLARVRPHWTLQVAVAAHLGEVDVPAGVQVLTYHPPAAVAFADGPAHDLLRLHFGDWLASHHPDAVLVLSPFEAGGVPVRFVGAGPPSLTVFYDLIMLLFPLEYMARHQNTWQFVSRQMRQVLAADGLLAISEATRHDLTDLLGAGQPVANIRGAVTADLPPRPPGEAAAVVADLFARKGFPAGAAGGGFLLYVGGGDFRKNLPTLLRAYARLPQASRAGRAVVIAGEFGPRAEALRDLAERLGVGQDLFLLGHVTDAELTALYQAARVFAFPSLYEGLGLPVLEALSCGADVAAGDTSSLREFSGPGTEYFDPADPDDMAHALYRVLARPEPFDPAAKKAFADRFTWAATAETASRAIEAAVAEPRRPPPPTRIVWRRSFGPGTTADDLRLFCDVLNAGRDLTLMRLPDDPMLPPVLAPRVRARQPHEIQKAEELTPTAVHVYELDTVRDLGQAAAWLVRRPGFLIVSAGLARSDVWYDHRFAAARKAADRILVRRGLAAGEPPPPGFAGASGSDADFPRLLAETEAASADPDRRWRDAAVAALTGVPAPADSFTADWAALRVAGRPDLRRTLAP